MYGTQAAREVFSSPNLFENDVNMYGTQAQTLSITQRFTFENDVNMYGTQATIQIQQLYTGLRMM